MKPLVRFLVPVALVLCIAAIAVALGAVLLACLPLSVASMHVVRVIVAIPSLLVGTWFVVAIGRTLVASPVRSNTNPEPVQEYKYNPSIDNSPRVRVLQGVPACGDLSLKKLSLDPRTRANIQKLRDKEAKRRGVHVK